MGAPSKMKKMFFGGDLSDMSVLRLRVTARDGQGTSGVIERIYRRGPRLEGHIDVGSLVHYVGMGDAWGRTYAEPGQTIVAFLSARSNGLYESAHHIRIEQIEDVLAAVMLYRSTPLAPVPDWLATSAKPYKGTATSYVPLELLERYLA